MGLTKAERRRRSRVRSVRPIAAFVLMLAAACVDAGADHMLLDRYFAAARLLDRTELARFSTVVFEPTRDGIVTRFTVVSASETREPPFALAHGDAGTSRIVELSLANPVGPEVAPPSRVTIATRHVGVDATVRSPTGTLSQRQLDVTLHRAEASDGPQRRGRWIVTSVSEHR